MVAGYGQLNYVASCWSSTTEGASDVSPFHLFHFGSQRFTFSPASISSFWGCGFGCGFVFVLFFVLFFVLCLFGASLTIEIF